MLREVVNLLQPLLASGSLLEGHFRLICTCLVPLGGFCSMGRTKQPVCACCVDMREDMQ